MSDNNCACRNNCTTIALIVSIIVGIIAAFLRITATITVTPAFLWVVFGIAVVYLGVLLITMASVSCCENKLCCVGSIISVLLGAIIATVFFAIVLLAIEFAATSIIGAIITGLLLLSFFLVLTETACLVRCMATGRE